MAGRAPNKGVNWSYDSLTPTLAQFTVKTNFAAYAIAEQLAKDIKQYMFDNAPWQDRTTDARHGLDTDVKGKGSFRTEIFLFHTVDYGIWLEVIQDGQYAIIVPTLEHYSGVQTWTYFSGLLGAATLGRRRRGR